MFSLDLNGKAFSIEELKTISPEGNEFEKSTLKFCKAWLSGQNEFKLSTSGSTGTPKEITISREAMEASAQMTISTLRLKSNDTALVCLDTKYIAGQMMLVRSLLAGMNVVAVEPSANPFNNVSRSIDFTALVPYQLEAILNQSPEKLDKVRCAIIGGAAVSNSLRDRIQKCGCAIYATYGMTETISHIALQKLNGADAQDYFEALENIRLRLDERGCLRVSASHLKEEIITNDIVELLTESKFKWLGRADNMINSGGVKVSPEKVESVLEKIFDSLTISNRFFVAGPPDEKLGQHVVVVFEGKSLDYELQQEILSKAAQHLTKYEVPKGFRFLEKFFETATGKINRIESLKLAHAPHST